MEKAEPIATIELSPAEHLWDFVAHYVWPAHEKLVFEDPKNVGFPAVQLMATIFGVLSGGRTLPTATVSLGGRRSMYSFGVDTVGVTSEGDGIVFSQQCLGAVIGEEVDEHLYILVGDQVRIGTMYGVQRGTSEIAFWLSATAEALDGAIAVVVTSVTAAGLVLSSRKGS